METKTPSPIATHITPSKLFALVRGLSLGDTGRPPDDEEDPTPGPFDPVIRAAIKEWLALGASDADEAALNPQPLPPRSALIAFLAQKVVERAELLHELASAISSEGEKRGIIIVSGYVAKFIHEVRQANFFSPSRDTVKEGNAFGPIRKRRCFRICLPWPPFKFEKPDQPIPVGDPFPGPNPLLVNPSLNATDLVVLGNSFAESARHTFDPALRQVFNDAAAQLAEAGAARL